MSPRYAPTTTASPSSWEERKCLAAGPPAAQAKSLLPNRCEAGGTSSVQNSRCTGGGASPLSIFINPRIDKTLAAHVRLSAFDAFGSKYPSRRGRISVHTDGDRFGRNLLFLRVGRAYARQKFGFVL